MSELKQGLREPQVGDFVRCNFPHMSQDPYGPSAHEHCALIVGIGYDCDLDKIIYTMVHSNKEIERLIKTGGKIRPGHFKLLVHAITGRVPVDRADSEIEVDRIVNPQQVMLLPADKKFFHDLDEGKMVVIDSIGPAAVEEIRLKMKKPPSTSALATYRVERENLPVRPDYLIIKTNEKDWQPGG